MVQNATGSGDDFDDIVMTLKKRFDRRREAYKIRVKRIVHQRINSYARDELHTTCGGFLEGSITWS